MLKIAARERVSLTRYKIRRGVPERVVLLWPAVARHKILDQACEVRHVVRQAVVEQKSFPSALCPANNQSTPTGELTIYAQLVRVPSSRRPELPQVKHAHRHAVQC